MTKKYRVESYAAYEIPDPFWMKRGEFDTADEALKCAQSIVRGSIEGSTHVTRFPCDRENVFARRNGVPGAGARLRTRFPGEHAKRQPRLHTLKNDKCARQGSRPASFCR